MKNSKNRLKKAFYLVGILLMFSSINNVYGQAQCEVSVNHGQGFSTTIQSVVDNCDGTHTITLRVNHNGCTGPACKELSNYAIQATAGTYSNVSVNVTSGGMTYSNVDMGPNLGAMIPFNGFKVDGVSGIGDGMAGSFEVTYTLSGGLQNQKVSAKPGPDTLVETFTIANFESVMTCQGNTCAAPDGPTANNDSATTPFETPVDISILNNDIAGDNPLDPTSVSFIAGTEPNAATEGVFTYNPSNGKATFTPAIGFSGTVTIDYQVCDMNALCDIATITVVVEPPAGSHKNLFPSLGFGTLAFEDLWPSRGDFDFNDLVIDYQFEITTNATNHVDKVVATFIIKAFGAAYQNGFGFQLSNAITASDLTVSGMSITENYITLSSNGTEAGQNAPTIIVFDNAYNEMSHPGGGAIGVNTELNATYIAPKSITVTIDFPAGKYTWNDLNIVNFNPFLIVDMERGREVHLPGYAPTALANPSYFGTVHDATNLAQGRTYVTSNNLPWAIHIFERFDYPIEKQDIIWVHLKFVEWAESGGEAFADWYKNKSGYRNQALIYKKP